MFSSFYSEKKKGTNADLVLQEARKWFRANTVQATLESDRWESKFEQHKKHSSLFRSVWRFWEHLAKCVRVSSRLRALSSCEASPLRKSVYNTVVEEEERNLLLKAVNGWVASLTQLPEVSKCYLLSRFLFFATLWTVAHQVPLCMEFSRQEHWSELPLPPPWDFPNPGVEPWSPALQADSLPSELPQLSESESESEVAQSCPTLFATPRTVAHQAPPSVGFSRQEYWSGLPFPSPGYICVFNLYISYTVFYLNCQTLRLDIF